MKSKYLKFYIFGFLFLLSAISFCICLETYDDTNNAYMTWFLLSSLGVFIFFILTIIFLIIGIVNSQSELKMKRKEELNNASKIASSDACYCPKCGMANSPSNEFCTSCGTKLVKTYEAEPLYEIIQKDRETLSSKMSEFLYFVYPIYIFLAILSFIVGFIIPFLAFKDLKIMYDCFIGLGWMLICLGIRFLLDFLGQKRNLENIISTNIKIYEDNIYAEVQYKKQRMNQCTVFRTSFANIINVKERKEKIYMIYRDGKLAKMILFEKSDNMEAYDYVKQKLEKLIKKK